MTPFQFGALVKQAMGPVTQPAYSPSFLPMARKPAPARPSIQPGSGSAASMDAAQVYRRALSNAAPQMPAPAPVQVPPLDLDAAHPVAPTQPAGNPSFGGMTDRQLAANVHPRTGGFGTRPLGPEGLTSAELPFGPGAQRPAAPATQPAGSYRYAKRTTAL